MLSSAPDGVCVTATVNALCMRVNWEPLFGAVSYSVYRSPIPHDSFKKVTSGVPGLTYFDNPQAPYNLNLRNAWYYKVSANDGTGEGPLSGPSSFLPYGQLADQNTPIPGLSLWVLLY